MDRLKWIVWVAVLFLATASQAGAEAPLSVFVSIQPQAYVVERIGKKRVAVEVLVPPGKSPATYAPRPSQMAKLSRATLFFSIGVPFEQALMPRIKGASQELTLVDTIQGIPLRRFADGGGDPHIWMNPILMKQQAITICNALIQKAPGSTDYFRANLEGLLADLDRLDRTIAKALAPLAGETIFVFHPVFGYFADQYGLTQMAVEVHGKAPKGRELAHFIKQAKAARIRVIFVQPQFDTRTAQKIATAINGAVVPLDPLAKDYITNLTTMAGTIKNAFK
ncbi:MAG: zinc ABC transporter substrate-binding protein [Desulfobacterium sp.]|nr:zinc ABC transporter substrate-binding protein [Desulfobacterium sp.]